MKSIKCKLYIITQWGARLMIGKFQSYAAAKREAKYLDLKNYFILKDNG